MLKLLRHFQKKWDDWCGDREMESAIRAHLSRHGYFGNTAKFEAVRLVAVERPGWVQVYRFEVRARVNDNANHSNEDLADDAIDEQPDRPPRYEELYGLVREDHRKHQTQVRVFPDPDQRRELFGRWSDGLICLRGAKGLVSS